MSAADPIDLLFGGMHKLGPGGDAHTLHVLRTLPARSFEVVVDAGCGTGRQTLVLARELGTRVHAVDTHQPFLDALALHAQREGLDHLVQTHHMDMGRIPDVFPHVDLLWSEGAAYSIGFANALTTWATAVRPGGLVVVSELSWLRDQIPERAREFFRAGYPDMRGVEDNLTVARGAGYDVGATYTLPREAWVDGYYDVLGLRAQALATHADPTVRSLAQDTIAEIAAFEASEDSYGYVFYVLRRT